MRILSIAHSYPLHPGDATAPFMESIVGGLAGRGHSLDVLLPEHPHFRQGDRNGIRFLEYRYSPVAGWAPWGYGRALTGDSHVSPQAALALPAVLAALRRRTVALLSSEAYDVIHAHWLVPNAWLAASPATSRRVPLVISLHGSDVAVAEKNAILRSIAHRTFRAAGGVTACSDDLRQRAIALGASPTSTRTVHYGVDTDLFVPDRHDAAVRTKLGAVNRETFLVVAVGRLVEKKGFSYLIDAAGQLEGVQVAILGEGALRPELERQARASHASVTFAGEVDRSGVATALAAADVVAVPSVVDTSGNVDGLPNTLLEALSAGRPVIASAVAGIPEVVEDGVNGLLVPEKDVASLAHALTSLRESHELRDRLGHEARARALRELSWDAAAEAFERVLSTAGRGGNPRQR